MKKKMMAVLLMALLLCMAFTGCAEQVLAALYGGITMLQLREKQLAPELFLQEAKLMKALCREFNVPLIINDNVEIALACQADGVHIGQDDMPVAEVRKLVGPGMLIGVSASNVEEARAAVAGGADYLGVGAVFPTTTTDTRIVTVTLPLGITEVSVLSIKDARAVMASLVEIGEDQDSSNAVMFSASVDNGHGDIRLVTKQGSSSGQYSTEGVTISETAPTTSVSEWLSLHV